jgi:hypothetical protein
LIVTGLRPEAKYQLDLTEGKTKTRGRRIVSGRSPLDEYRRYRSFRYPACPIQRPQKWTLAAAFDRIDILE